MSTYKGSFTCIAVDMGAGSIRIMLGVIDEGGISYEEIHRITNEIVDHEGHERWDMGRMIREIRTGISMAIEVSRNTPQSIGVDSWGVDFVLLDEKGELVELPVAYRDSRTEGMQEQWGTGMSAMETFQRTGINFYIFNTLYQLLSIRDSEKLRRSSKILFMPCYINYLLTGEAKNELTISSTSQMLGVEGAAWEERVLDLLHLEYQKLGDVIFPGTKLGRVTLPETEGIHMESVAVCGHDTACVVAAIPVEDQNFAYISSGTWCIVGVESDRPLISEKAQHLGFTNERGYGNSYRTLKNIVGLWLLQGLKKSLPEGTTYADMEQMTKEEVKSVQIIDPDDPSFYNPEEMKVAFDAYFHKTGQPMPESFSGYIKCAYDSLCFSFRFYIEQMEQLSGRSIEVLHVVGGGSQSDYLNQRIATICGRKVISGPVEGATIGNILIQAIAMGKMESLDEGRKLVKRSFPGNTYLAGKELPGAEDRYEKFLTLKTK
ncbi:MAG: rhamnulokinase [Bacteroidales bacterium]|nr:rhamnulokinase [Bacteroidales bacterium]